MPRDARDRITQAPVAEGQEPATAEEREAAEEDARNPVVAGGVEGKQAHELPPQLRPQTAPPTREQLIGWGLSDAEITTIFRTIAAKSDGLIEYDEEAEAERIHQTRLQAHRIAQIDGGSPVQLQSTEMELYFAGQIPRGDGKFCVRQPFVSPVDVPVGINGYIFRIPAFKRVNLPLEAIDILEKAAQAQGNLNMVSAALQARAAEPIYMRQEMSAQQFLHEQQAAFPVREGFVNTSDSLWPVATR